MDSKNRMQDKKRCGRPRKQNQSQRSELVTIRFTKSELEGVDFKATQANVSRGAYIRSAAISGRVVARFSEEELRLLRAFWGVKNNLNQLAKTANAYGMQPLLTRQIVAALMHLNGVLSKR